MPDTIFSEDGLKDYFYWQTQDRKTLNRINSLIQDILRNGFLKGTGKPEALKHRKAFSREIDEANRLIYTGDEKQNLRILSCRGHYID
jgi:toxin YoeB